MRCEEDNKIQDEVVWGGVRGKEWFGGGGKEGKCGGGGGVDD